MRRAAAALPLCLALLLPACSGDGGGDRGEGSPTTSATAPGTASPAPPATTPPAVPTLPPLAGAPRFVGIAKFDSPLHVAAPAGDRRVFVVEKGGRVKVFANNTVLAAPFLDIADEVSTNSERGLLSIAFPPDFATSRKAYVNYTATDGDITVAEYAVSAADPDRLDESSRRILLQVPHPRSNHNGGQLLFDAAGNLLVSTGDGGGANDPDDNAQDLGSLLGKILRIDPRRPSDGREYGIPADNPFAGRDGVRPEIWAYGLRNPWRMSFGPDGTLYVGDVGQYAVEELNAVPAAARGANFGWPAYEGRRRTTKPVPTGPGRLVEPAYTYEHAGTGGCAVTAGFAYRGRVSRLRGRFLFGDFCVGRLMSLPAPGLRGSPAALGPGLETPQLSSFGEDGFGDVFVTSLAGPVYKISAG